jgi:hypothetical protein
MAIAVPFLSGFEHRVARHLTTHRQRRRMTLTLIHLADPARRSHHTIRMRSTREIHPDEVDP